MDSRKIRFVYENGRGKNGLHKVFGEWFMISCPGGVRSCGCCPLSVHRLSEEQGTWTFAEHCEVTGSAQDGRLARGRGEGSWAP